jgi:DNA repair exonuclease SbcCD ATPase subunit
MTLSFEQWMMLGAFLVTLTGAGISIYSASATRKNLEAQTDVLKAQVRNLEEQKKTLEAQVTNLQAQTTTEDAKASESYANASKMVADELVAVRKQMTNLNLALDERDKLIFQLQGDNADLKDWAERLVHQLQSQSFDPVPFRSLRSQTQPRK